MSDGHKVIAGRLALGRGQEGAGVLNTGMQDLVGMADGQAPTNGGRDLAQLIVTTFAVYARPEGDWLSVASLVELMSCLDAESQAVRSSVSRLKRRGVLAGERRGAAAGYSLTAPTLEVLAEGDVRIFERGRASLADGWLVVVFSVPEPEREKRYELRSSLTRLGFGSAAPGVWVAPGSLAEETKQTLERRRLSGYVDIFKGDRYAFGDLAAKVMQWWDLGELTRMYADFLARYRPVLDEVRSGGVTSLRAFRVYVPMLTQWRRLPYRDPGIPLSLLPPGWNGVAAGTLFGALNETLAAPASEHAQRIIHQVTQRR